MGTGPWHNKSLFQRGDRELYRITWPGMAQSNLMWLTRTPLSVPYLPPSVPLPVGVVRLYQRGVGDVTEPTVVPGATPTVSTSPEAVGMTRARR